MFNMSVKYNVNGNILETDKFAYNGSELKVGECIIPRNSFGFSVGYSGINGPIYEGDIVDAFYNNEYINGIVVYVPDINGFMIQTVKGFLPLYNVMECVVVSSALISYEYGNKAAEQPMVSVSDEQIAELSESIISNAYTYEQASFTFTKDYTELVPEPCNSGNEDFYEIYTDGSCLGKKGSLGGYGIIILKNGVKKWEISGCHNETTNNIMELTGPIKSLRFLREKVGENLNIVLYSDSQYVTNGFNKRWIASWIEQNWINSSGKPVCNKELWEILLEESRKQRISYKWIKGHNNNLYNEFADGLALKAAKSQQEYYKEYQEVA